MSPNREPNRPEVVSGSIASEETVGIFVVHVPHSKLGEPGAPSIHVESQFALAQPLTRFLLLRDAFSSEARDLRGRRARHNDDTVGVADDDVARSNQRAGADN